MRGVVDYPDNMRLDVRLGTGKVVHKDMAMCPFRDEVDALDAYCEVLAILQDEALLKLLSQTRLMAMYGVMKSMRPNWKPPCICSTRQISFPPWYDSLDASSYHRCLYPTLATSGQQVPCTLTHQCAHRVLYVEIVCPKISGVIECPDQLLATRSNHSSRALTNPRAIACRHCQVLVLRWSTLLSPLAPYQHLNFHPSLLIQIHINGSLGNPRRIITTHP